MRAVDLVVLLDRSGVDLRLSGGRLQVRGEIPPSLAASFQELRPEMGVVLRARSDLPDDPEVDVENHRPKASRYSLAEVEVGLRHMTSQEREIYLEIFEDYRADVPGYPIYGEELASRLAYALTRGYWRREGSRLFRTQTAEEESSDET